MIGLDPYREKGRGEEGEQCERYLSAGVKRTQSQKETGSKQLQCCCCICKGRSAWSRQERSVHKKGFYVYRIGGTEEMTYTRSAMSFVGFSPYRWKKSRKICHFSQFRNSNSRSKRREGQHGPPPCETSNDEEKGVRLPRRD